MNGEPRGLAIHVWRVHKALVEELHRIDGTTGSFTATTKGTAANTHSTGTGVTN